MCNLPFLNKYIFTTFVNLKWSSLIFSLYIIVQSCLPCGDSQECDVTKIGQSFELATQHSDHEHEKENCTPFCSCSCCGSQVYKALAEFHVSKIVHYAEKAVPFYQVSFNSQYTGKIWQPPKIG
jgi:hypothetical protein